MPILKSAEGHKSKMEFFESPEAYADYIEKIIPQEYLDAHFAGTLSFSDPGKIDYRYGTLSQALKGLRQGDISLTKQVEQFMDELRNTDILSVGLPMPRRSMVGAMTLFPLFDAGIPNCMINRELSDVRGVNSPITVYWDRFSSLGLDNAKVIRRGLAITAFVMAMNNIRPVNLYMISASCPDNADYRAKEAGLYGGIIRVESRPLDLARAAWMFCNPAFSRPITWANARYQFNLATGKRPNGLVGPIKLRHDADSRAYAEEIRSIIGMQPDDILIHGMSIFDKLSYTDPIEWIKQMIQKHVNKQQLEGETENTHDAGDFDYR